ncbi:MAG: hypothetical protein QGG39_11905 [Candidatus Poribacteria bacterium]|nr:hypothetical protein [Candidatus Poribacteria bacterium]
MKKKRRNYNAARSTRSDSDQEAESICDLLRGLERADQVWLR